MSDNRFEFPADSDGDSGYIKLAAEHTSALAFIDVDDYGVYLSYETVRGLVEWGQKVLDENKPALPEGDYAVIEAVLDYGHGPFTQRLVRVPSAVGESTRHYWADQELDYHDLTGGNLKSFTVLSEGI